MDKGEKILITGGAGYIGSHACVAAIEAGYQPVVLDNLTNSSPVALQRVAEITGQHPILEKGDVTDRVFLKEVFVRHQLAAVIHMAGLKAVGESCQQPLHYYRNNVVGTIMLCEVMAEHQLGVLIFSSSATVYGESQQMPVQEKSQRLATNPYGSSKLMVEYLLEDLARADQLNEKGFWNIASLRYFNPIGAHPSGFIGEDPRGIPDNLAPFVAQVASGRHREVLVFGDDYPTRDGTGLRDYLHVMDLVQGHIAALEYLLRSENRGFGAWNLGTGRACSVLEMISAFESSSGKVIPYRVVERRPGDVAECWADVSKAERELGWKASRDLREMVADAWRWQLNNPNGYG